MKTYSGRRFDPKQKTLSAEVKIVLDDGSVRELPPRLDLFSHSPTGFEWGYAGSGPAQLALALLADALRCDTSATRPHQPFKFRVISRLDRDAPWRMTEDDIVRYAATISELPLMRMPNGSIRVACIDCTGYLRDRSIMMADALGIFECVAGVTFDDAKAAVAGHHQDHPLI